MFSGLAASCSTKNQSFIITKMESNNDYFEEPREKRNLFFSPGFAYKTLDKVINSTNGVSLSLNGPSCSKILLVSRGPKQINEGPNNTGENASVDK